MKNDRHIPWILLEDEYYTAGELKRLVGRVSSKYHNIAIIDTCKRFREYWRRSPNADLIITDESLADGPVTGVLEDLEVKTPVIVVTSNEERRPQDFSGKILSILLHPVELSAMSDALQRFESAIL